MAAIAAVADRFGFTFDDLIGSGRTEPLVWVRHMAYVEVRRARPHLSLHETGTLFGYRDHTTIMHGIQRHRQREAWCDVMRVLASFGDSRQGASASIAALSDAA
jgi:chromosomal replication initiation ATPase DnaA